MQLEHGAYTVTFSISQERTPGIGLLQGPLMHWTDTHPKQQTSAGADGKAVRFFYLLSASSLWLAARATVLLKTQQTPSLAKPSSQRMISKLMNY